MSAAREIAMIFQDPMTSLNPMLRSATQITETIGGTTTCPEARRASGPSSCSSEVGIPEPPSALDDYPHRFSGGMCQRAMIAMALACNPKLLIADEPTTALDVTVQAQSSTCSTTSGTSTDGGPLITHDLGVVAEMADDVVVMYAGKIVETRPPSTSSSTPTTPTPRRCSHCRSSSGERTAAL